MIVLGIESSCDETAAAIVMNGKKVLSSVVSSQVSVHHPFGGVVPELASRKHIEMIVPVVKEALLSAGIPFSRIDGVAATRGPGLVGALLVGYTFAKAYAFGLSRPFIGVDHLEGHLNSILLSDCPPEFPFVALLASGGHTSLYRVVSPLSYELLGQTLDDAAGEAYDKVSKMMGLGYPGGQIIDALAERGDPSKVDFPVPFVDKNGLDFSFSGLKTAVNRYLHTSSAIAPSEDIAAAFQKSVVTVLSHKLIAAAERNGLKHIALVGGVAANKGLRRYLEGEALCRGMILHIPAIELCGDNAAMIAAVGYHRFFRGERSPFNEDVYSRFPMRTIL